MTLSDHSKNLRFGASMSLWICLILTVATLATYFPLRSFDFIRFDDSDYVTENHQVRSGLTLRSVKWAFQSSAAANWHPLTWLSHMLDVTLYGMHPGAHHLTNLLFHTINTLLLFRILTVMSGAMWQSAVVAMLFALHPLHVESVAWIAERKDVLSTFFWLLVMRCYVAYAARPSAGRYLGVLLFLGLGLMAKPMLVTLPFVLLLLDYWPLKRIPAGFFTDRGGIARLRLFRTVLVEKIPLFGLVMLSCVITFIVQQQGRAVAPLELYSFKIRFGNAMISYVAYLGKMLWPVDLAVLYPHPGTFFLWPTLGACLVLAAISLIVLMNLRRRPYLAVGWFWYLGTLVPVIGLVQVGSQALADRYTYVPLIGAFIMVVWGGGELFAGWFCRRKISVLLVLGLMGALMLVTRQQVRYWRDSITLFEHTLAVTEKNCTIHSNLGTALVSNGRIDDAVRHYQQAIEACPGYAEAYNNLGVAHSRRGENRRAEGYFRRAISLRQEYVQAHINLGFARVAQGQWQDGLNYYNQALSLDPENFRAYNSIGLVHVRRGDFTAAIQFFSEALRIWPQFASARNNLRQTLEWQEKIDAELAGLAAAIKSAAGKEFRQEASGQLTDRKSQLDSVIAQYRGILAKLPGFNPADFDLNRYPYYRDVLKDYTRRVSALENKPPGGAN